MHACISEVLITSTFSTCGSFPRRKSVRSWALMNELWGGHDQCSYSGVYPQQHHWLELIRASGVFLTSPKTSCIYSVCPCYRHRLCVWGMLPIKRRNFPLRRWQGILAKRFGKKLLGPRQGPRWCLCGACVQLSNLKFPNSLVGFANSAVKLVLEVTLQIWTLEPLSWKFRSNIAGFCGHFNSHYSSASNSSENAVGR